MRKILPISLFLFLGLLLSACGSSNSPVVSNTGTLEKKVITMSGDLSSGVAQVSGEVLSITDSEVINGITVPPEPDPVLNDATLTGVDINGNGVRDDVERVLVEKFGTKPNYQSFFDYAKAEQDLIVSGSEGSIKNYITMVECKDFPAKEANIITYKTLNNKIRNQKYGNLLAGMVLESCNK